MASSTPEDRQVILLREADFALDGGAMFGIIPRPIWEKTNPADEGHRIDMATRCLLIKDRGRNIVVDVGIGDRWSDRHRDIYKIADQDPGFENALSTWDLSPADIDDVILTHLHFDHAGGLTRFDNTGDLVPTFPNATHWVQRRNFSWAFSPSARDAGSYRREDFAFLHREGAPELELIDGIDEIIDGIEVLPVHGHTFGMQVVKIDCHDATYAFLADLIPTTSHLRDPYVMGYDLQPLKTVEEKREILYWADKHDWILLFEHDPTTPAGRVEFDERDEPRLIPIDKPPESMIRGDQR